MEGRRRFHLDAHVLDDLCCRGNGIADYRPEAFRRAGGGIEPLYCQCRLDIRQLQYAADFRVQGRVEEEIQATIMPK